MVFALTWTNEDGTFDVVEFDTHESEDHTLPNEVTEFPVEQGPDVTDNVRVKPRTLAVKGYISDSPLYQNPGVVASADYQNVTLDLPNRPDYVQKTVDLDVPASPIRPNAAGLVSAGITALFGSSPKATVLQRGPDQPAPKQTVQVLQFSAFQSRVRAVWELLKKAAQTKVLVTAITDFDEVAGLVIESLGMPRTEDDGTGASIELTLRQITIATSQEAAAPKPAEPAAQARKFAGSKAAKEDQNAQEKAKSLAKRIVGGAIDLLGAG